MGDISEKLVSVHFKLLNIAATNCAFSIQRDCDLLFAPTPCADVTRLCMLDIDAGKGRQVIKCIHAAQLQNNSGPECFASLLATLHTMAEEHAAYVL